MEKTVIGNYKITDAEIDQFIMTLPAEQQMYKSVPQFREQVKNRLVEIALFAMDGEENKLDETQEFKDTLNIAKRDILSQVAIAKTIEGIEVSPDEAKEFYANNKERFDSPATVSAKHILVDSEDKINLIKKEIEDGTKTFEEAAMEYSTCPSGKSGGSLGTFGKGQMVKEFEDAAFSGELNTVIGPVKTQFGYHLIWIDERNNASVKEFDVVKDKVYEMAKHHKQQQAYDAKIAQLKEKYL